MIRPRNACVALLVVVNVALAVALVLKVWPDQPAFAQVRGLSSRYAMVAGQVESGYDAVYILDAGERKLYALVPGRGINRAPVLIAQRDLEADFRRQP